MQYRRTPLPSGYSPSELLHGRQIRALIDVLVPSQHSLQIQQNKLPNKAKKVASNKPDYSVGTPCYALYFGPIRDKDPKWVLAIVTKKLGTRTVNVRVFPQRTYSEETHRTVTPNISLARRRRSPRNNIMQPNRAQNGRAQ